MDKFYRCRIGEQGQAEKLNKKIKSLMDFINKNKTEGNLKPFYGIRLSKSGPPLVVIGKEDGRESDELMKILDEFAAQGRTRSSMEITSFATAPNATSRAPDLELKGSKIFDDIFNDIFDLYNEARDKDKKIERIEARLSCPGKSFYSSAEYSVKCWYSPSSSNEDNKRNI